MLKFLTFAISILWLAGCQPPTPQAPPELDAPNASIEELQAYVAENCQGDFRLHVRCINAMEFKRKKVMKRAREKQGVLGTIRSEKELFGK